MITSSYKDPSGFIFKENDLYYRSVDKSYQVHYDQLMQSGLYGDLVNKKWLVPHKEIEQSSLNAYKILFPQQLNYISYPYEWSFDQLKDAALLTLDIQEAALEYEMSLKDATAYNVQFQDGQAIFIDTLSFENRKDKSPWVAYRQFCQHFLGPLALMAHTDISLNQLLQVHLDGIPLSLTKQLLPLKCKFNTGLQMHILMHANFDKKGKSNPTTKESGSQKQFTDAALKGLINSLRSTVSKLNPHKKDTNWNNYYAESHLGNGYLEHKDELVENFTSNSSGKTLLDLGANNGHFSRLLKDNFDFILSVDGDPYAVTQNYKENQESSILNILPLVIDICNPSPAIGWNNNERESFLERTSPDTTLALALIHHLVIGNNLPLNWIAKFFADLTNELIIEFVPKADRKVKEMLAFREDIFDDYTIDNFEHIFQQHFVILENAKVQGSERVLYKMELRERPE